LFQTLLVIQNTPALTTEVPGLTIEPLDLVTGTAKFDLVLNVVETTDGLTGRWQYNRELFEAATMARMAGHFEALLTSILANPGQRIEDLALLGAAERQQIAVGWNDTAADLPLESTFQELFEAVAERAPASLAVAVGPHRISYGELNVRAKRLARSLLAAGVGREELVAVLAERGADLLVAMLALFKAGGVYLPLDPHHPAQRLLQTVEQSASRLVLVSDSFRGSASILATEERKVLALSELLAEERSAENLPCRSGPTQLAYVLFTSGSTGAPKGVMIPQRGMINHLLAKISALGLTDRDRVAETALQTFDISIWQFLAALLAGGSVQILSDEVVHDPLRLLDAIEGQGITVFETVPSLLSALLQVDERFRPRLASLRWLILTGEALPPELCRAWLSAYPDIPLVNAYGPTECSDDVTHQILRQPPVEGTIRTPIGSPVLNTCIHVLEPGGDLAPVGVPGELAVGDVQVGRGYWGRPELTSERFVPDPFGAEPGARLYRTGDLARWRASGEVEFLGRIDYQVKVRGFRIELGDIESSLLRHPAVREAVVLARPQDAGALDQRLVAYVVASEGEEIVPADLREFVQKSLPEYMVPSAFVTLVRLPLTPNGKVDRKALPAPEDGAAAGPQGFVAPRTDLERSLCELLAEVLGLAPQQVSVEDSFFEIGGDSIRGAILINRLQKKLSQIVHVVALFDHPTVAGLAAYLMRDYPEAVARLWGLDLQSEAAPTGRIGVAEVARLREIIPPLSPALIPADKNPPAVFVLSAPRSGSTLLRAMLGGHPRLFAPPELELLSFTDMAERRAAFSGRNAFWLEGLLRAVMAALHCGADEAKALVERCEEEALPTRLVYRRLQQWIGPRTLVDKTPSYALSRDALERAETDFAGARYIHLIRHPNAVIHSFEEARLDQVFFRHAHPFTRRELGELIWTVSHQNIADFLAAVPAERQHWLRFEDLVRDPVAVLSDLCEFLGLDFHPDMAEPYKDSSVRMTDGLHAQSRMLGDVKFHQHAGVEAGAAERWRRQTAMNDLGEPTHQLAALLGYDTRPPEAPAIRRSAHPEVLVPLQASGSQPPLFLVHPVGGEVSWYLALARHLGTDQPVYGLQRPAHSTSADYDLPTLAERYVEAVRSVQGAPPYLLGGWSLGAVVAFEMARQLRSTGDEVDLVMIDPPPPFATPQGDGELALLRSLARELEGHAGRSLGLAAEDFERIPPEERLRHLLIAAQAAGALSSDLRIEDLQGEFRERLIVIQQNRQALRTYVPGFYPGRLTLFRAIDSMAGAGDPSFGWTELAAGGAVVHLLPGDHESILRAPAVETLAGLLLRELGRGAVEGRPEIRPWTADSAGMPRGNTKGEETYGYETDRAACGSES
jgi:amino acid adenylation domain-containing protein